MGFLRGEGVGGGMPESCRVELDEKRRQKRLAFSEGVFATEPSERIRGGKADLQKLLEIFLTRGRPEIFISRRAMEVSALPFYESTLSPSKNIPATIPNRMKISKNDRRRVFPSTISIVSPEGQENNCHRTKDFEEKKI